VKELGWSVNFSSNNLDLISIVPSISRRHTVSDLRPGVGNEDFAFQPGGSQVEEETGSA
jgi:hypothetical protein